MNIYSKVLLFVLLFISVEIASQRNKLQIFTLSDGLPSLSINDIIQDEIGYLWLATDKGLVRFDGNQFKHFNLHSSSKANALFYKNDALFIGYNHGLFIKKEHEITSLGKEKVIKIVSIDNKIICCTTQGIFEFKEGYLQPLPISTQIDFSIINDVLFAENSIYIATNRALWNIDQLVKPTRINKVLEDNSVSLLLEKNKIIVATSKNGIKIITNLKVERSINSEVKTTSIKKIDTELWVITNGNGIEVYNLNDFSFQKKINKYNSLISNEINTVFKDNQNNIWIASKKEGLYKYTNSDFNSNKHSNRKKKGIKPTIFIANISVNYKSISSLNTSNLLLKPTENNISFSYKTVDLSNPKNIKYRYKLKGNFSPWSKNNNVKFANLNEGNYTFVVQSKKGLQLSEEKYFSFSIDTPIYKKPWFLILSFAFILLLFALLIDVTIRKIKKKNQQEVKKLQLENHLLTLEQKALQLQMNPHFIFNVLNGIKALGNSGKIIELNKTISQFSLLLRSVLNNSRLEEISLKDEIESLKNYLELEKQMSSKTFEYFIETSLNNIDSEEILIPPMLIQPFIENSIKHGIQLNSKEGKITISFEVKHQFLQCRISDNGIGIHQSKKQKENESHHSVALKVTKERIKNLSKKSSFLIEETNNKGKTSGTKVSFKIPLKTDY
ncbi:sensor histidine kinase [Polaribacter sp. SA4-10]|uniref:sensor histidine kinase n=1 Tax=Polaribacter sp. SA4-10 TaxID=754397 RepID=UPI000B3CFE49|nr:sensor histidine kinase [Polaribacter sp. SA4-10]